MTAAFDMVGSIYNEETGFLGDARQTIIAAAGIKVTACLLTHFVNPQARDSKWLRRAVQAEVCEFRTFINFPEEKERNYLNLLVCDKIDEIMMT